MGVPPQRRRCRTLATTGPCVVCMTALTPARLLYYIPCYRAYHLAYPYRWDRTFQNFEAGSSSQSRSREPACFLFSSHCPSHLAADKFWSSLLVCCQLFGTSTSRQHIYHIASVPSVITCTPLLYLPSSKSITMPFTPVALFGLEVPAGDIMVPATMSSRATVSTRITNAFTHWYTPVPVARGQQLTLSDSTNHGLH